MDAFRLINTILILISFSISITILYVVYSFWKTIVNPQQLHNALHEKYSVKEDSVYNTEVQKIICRLKHDLSASKIIIARFHNGGTYVNGLPMKKFTVSHETAGYYGIPMMDHFVSILNSRYPEAFAQLATLGEYYIYDSNDCPDLNFKRDMEKYCYKATYLFLMKQFDGKEDGFIGVNFVHTKVMRKEERHKVIEQIPRIMGLLNMEKQHL